MTRPSTGFMEGKRNGPRDDYFLHEMTTNIEYSYFHTCKRGTREVRMPQYSQIECLQWLMESVDGLRITSTLPITQGDFAKSKII